MWPYVLYSAVLTLLFSVSLPIYGLTDATVEAIVQASLSLGVTAAVIAAVVCWRPRRPKLGPAEILEQAEYVGNIPPKWNIHFTAEVATVPRRPRLPPQSIFMARPRLAAEVASKTV